MTNVTFRGTFHCDNTEDAQALAEALTDMLNQIAKAQGHKLVAHVLVAPVQDFGGVDVIH